MILYTKLQRAQSIQRSAERLIKLIQLNAPEIVIESERKIILDLIIDFPVDTAAQAQLCKRNVETLVAQEKFLEEAGYYRALNLELGIKDDDDDSGSVH